MPGVPINSLADLMMLQEIKNNANMSYSAMQALGQGVGAGIMEQQARAKKKREQEDTFSRMMSLNKNNGNSTKIKTSIDEKGNASYVIEERDDSDLRKLAMQQDMEKRRLVQEDRRQIDTFGSVFNTQDKTDQERVNSMNLNLNGLVEQGKAERQSDGSIFVYDKTTRDRLEREQSVPEKVQESIAEFKDSKDILTDAVKEYEAMGLDEVKTDWNLIKQMFSPAGPLSLEAKSNMLRQFTNPRLAALADKLERVFQKYRTQVTGAQASDLEIQRLRPLIANLMQNPETFKRNAADLAKELDNAVSNRIGLQRIAGRDEKVLQGFEDFYFKGKNPGKRIVDVQVGVGDGMSQTSRGTQYKRIK
jgi:hypothetical protein